MEMERERERESSIACDGVLNKSAFGSLFGSLSTAVPGRTAWAISANILCRILYLSSSPSSCPCRARDSRYPCANIDACACAHLRESFRTFAVLCRRLRLRLRLLVAVVFHLVFTRDLG